MNKIVRKDFNKQLDEEGPTYAPDSPEFLESSKEPTTPDTKPPFWEGDDPREKKNDKYIASQEYLNKFLNIQGGKVENKYTYQQQISILSEFYKYSDNTKSIDDITSIINRRRPKGTKIGAPIPTAPWFKLCETLYDKYNIDPLDLAIFELTDIDRFSKRDDKFALSDKATCEDQEEKIIMEKFITI